MGLKVTGFRNDTEQPRLSGSIENDMINNKCILGRKPKTLKLGEEPERASMPMRLDDDVGELNPRTTPSKTYASGGDAYILLEKLAEKLRLLYQAIEAKPDWNTDSNLVNILNGMPVDLKKEFEITFYSKNEILKITGVPHLKYNKITIGYDLFFASTTQVQKQLIELLKA